MEIVKSSKNLEPLNQNLIDDFYKVPNLKFFYDDHLDEVRYIDSLIKNKNQ